MYKISGENSIKRLTVADLPSWVKDAVDAAD